MVIFHCYVSSPTGIDAGRCTFTEMWPGEYPSRIPAGIPSGTPSDTCHSSTLETHLFKGRKIHFKRPKIITKYRNCRLSLETLWSPIIAILWPQASQAWHRRNAENQEFVYSFFVLWVAGLGIESPPLSSQVRAEAFHVGHVSCLSGRMSSSHAARARGDNKTQGQVFDFCFSHGNLSCLDLQS